MKVNPTKPFDMRLKEKEAHSTWKAKDSLTNFKGHKGKEGEIGFKGGIGGV